MGNLMYSHACMEDRSFMRCERAVLQCIVLKFCNAISHHVGKQAAKKKCIILLSSVAWVASISTVAMLSHAVNPKH